MVLEGLTSNRYRTGIFTRQLSLRILFSRGLASRPQIVTELRNQGRQVREHWFRGY
jgi:hypothetical protein